MKAKAGKARISGMVREELARYSTGDDGVAFWWKATDGTGRERPSAEARDKDLNIHVAGRVLEAIGIADWHGYPWHRFCDGGAEAMVAEIVHRELLRREAEAAAARDSHYGLLEHVGSAMRRR